ncbi:MAG: type IV pilus assembly protein PilM [Mycetocola sp.]
MTAHIVGLDIGETAVRGVEVRVTPKSGASILRYHEVPLSEGAVRSGEVLEVNTVAAALKRLWLDGKFKTKDVVIGMGNQKVLARDLTVPRMPLASIRESLPFHVQDLIQVPVADALLDFYPIAEVEGENGPAVSGLLIAAVKEAVMINLRAVREAGLSPVGVDLIGFALQRVLGKSTGETTALIDVGASTTNVVLAIDGVPRFIRIIPAGGEDITRALMSRLEIDRQQAEGLKRSIGLAPAAAHPEHRIAVGVIEDTAGELLSSLRNTLKYFANTRQDGTAHRIALTGGAAQLPGFAQALGSITRVPITLIQPFGPQPDPTSRKQAAPAPDDEPRRSRMAVALGLGLGAVA